MDALGASRTGSDKMRVIEAGMIGAIAQWCECLHGKEPILKTLEILAVSLEAEAIAIARSPKDAGTAPRVIAFDRRAADAMGGRLDHSYARSVLRDYFDRARAGTIWFKSMVEDSIAQDLQTFHSRRHMSELVIIPLEVGERTIDTLEIHFIDRPRNYQQALLNMLGETLTRTWRNRARGLFTEALLRVEEARASAQPGPPILSVENPARLSRAEYRVCLLLSRGRSTDAVKEELHISDSTLRTHLSNLYAKTGTHNLAELLYSLVTAAPFGDSGSGSSKVA